MIQSIHREDPTLLPSRKFALVPEPRKDITQLATQTSPGQEAFFTNLRIQLGDGSKTKFWFHPWVSHVSLKDSFPDLYTLSSQHNHALSSTGWFEGNMWRWWPLSWRR